VARFQREAKLLASLNHPNIAAIHGLEESSGTNFLVLELVEGDTLADRIKAGPVPVEEALKLALQIAEALEAAHEKGVIHRDLKPSNIKVTPDGKVKVLDFGLAKALSDETQSVDSSQSPTITEAMTRPGVILGTAAYMSPEQAKGKAVDKRADIWAFGCILYECLTGKRAFEGETVTETLAAILKAEPEWKSLPPTVPQNIRFVLHRCLEREVSRRFRAQPFDDRSLELGGEPKPLAEQVGSYGPSGFFSASINGTLVYRQPVDGRLTWVDRGGQELNIIGESAAYSTFDLSNDGTRLVVAKGYGGGETNLWVMDLLRGSTTRLTLEEADHTDPRWSPDGRSVMYKSTAESLMRLFEVSLQSPNPMQVFKYDGWMFGLDDWSPDGRSLLYHPSGPELWLLPLTGDRKPMLVTRSLSGSIDQAQFSPDGHWIAY
jgi:serine/threonine protein kinase